MEMNKEKTIKIYSAVLAGGRSTRMGQDKRFLKYKNQFLIDYMIQLAAEATNSNQEQIFCCGYVPNRNCLSDKIEGIGPLGGVLAATQKVIELSPKETHAWLLVLPVDMPLLNLTILKFLIDSVYRVVTNKMINVVKFENFTMPFIIRCEPKLNYQSLLNGLDFSLKNFQKKLGVYELVCSSEFLNSMKNVNYPQDWLSL
jgi:molybdopterin-guanine dinucleotide biosynthesis protein A